MRRVEQHHRLLLERTSGDVTLHERRFASLADRHLVVQRQTVTAPPGTALTFEAAIVGAAWSLNGEHLHDHRAEDVDGTFGVTATTGERSLPIAIAQSIDVIGVPTGTCSWDVDLSDPLRPRRTLELVVGDTGVVSVVQSMAVMTGHDLVAPDASPSPERTRPHARLEQVRSAATEHAERARTAGHDALVAEHTAAWDALWADLDVRIDGDAVSRVVLRFNLAQAVMATPMHATHLPLGARGLSTQAY